MDIVSHFILLCLLSARILSWNIETRTPVIFTGDKDSYFGFTVALHDNSEGSFALIAATRANSSLPGRRNLHQPGVLYKCSISTTMCEEVVFEEKDSVLDLNASVPYRSKEDNMWLGVSLDVKSFGDGEIVTCAHLWKDDLYINLYATSGACYTIDRDLSKSSYKIFLPFLTGRSFDQDYAFQEAGASAAFSKDGDLIIGAPGHRQWEGNVLSYKLLNYPNYSPYPAVPIWPREEEHLELYRGYSVTTGRFFEWTQQQIATGAPRDGFNRGRVYIVESVHQDKKDITIQQTLEGERIGEYFGACVLGVDINEDSYTDLLVGSPFYSLRSGGDEGKVYVYVSNGRELEKPHEIMGSRKSESRFGTSIANAGDLNQDGYQDVAIGAPYEDNVGAVYIYHGGPQGILSDYSQRIDVSRINPPLSGFGISISRGKDIDDNHYPDLLIGSFLSDKALLFRTRPVVMVHANLTFDPLQVNTNPSSLCHLNSHRIPCFNVSVCLSYNGSHAPEELDLSITLSSARKSKDLQVRRYLMQSDKLSSHLHENITLRTRYGHCFHISAYVYSDPDDFITPIQMTLLYQLAHDVNSEETFCKSCPILNPRIPLSVVNTMTFQTDCGEDDVCKSNLSLTADVRGLSSGNVIIGESNIVVLSAELENHGEPAYKSEIQIIIFPSVQIINYGSCKESPYSDYQTITCQAGNPLKTDDIAKNDIKFDTSLISSDFDIVIINITATTASDDQSVDDNEININIPLKVLTDITIVGHPEVEQIVLEKSHENPDIADIVHVYTVLKYLPSPISLVSVEILIPVSFPGIDVSFIQLGENIEINEGLDLPVPASCYFDKSDLRKEGTKFEDMVDTGLLNEVKTPRLKRLTTVKRGSTRIEPQMLDTTVTNPDGKVNYILDCTNSICYNISCTAGPFTKSRTSASFRISGFINITSLEEVFRNLDVISVETQGSVKISNQRENVQPEGHQPDEAKVATMLVCAKPLPAKKIESWVVAISAATGVLLFVLIFLGLTKIGFFRRKRKEDMEKMMADTEVKEGEPSMSNTETSLK